MQLIDSSRARDEPITLELGVAEIVSNPLLTAMEQAVRSHGVGDIIQLSLQGGEYDPGLVFKVPTDHPEIQRLQGRYKAYAVINCCTL
jgi:FKBP-type peptidyl-prolyl cis-trans isomerase 2